MQAIIMAGGLGSRLRPLTDHLPKPMVPIINKPILEYIVEHLRACGIRDIAMTLGYRPEIIMDYFGNGDAWDVDIRYFVETTPLGTAGGVRNAARKMDDDVLVVSGDGFTNLDFAQLAHAHKSGGCDVTMALKQVRDARGFGLVRLDEQGTVVDLIEKPSVPIGGLVNMGIYVLSPRAMRKIPRGKYDFAKDLFPQMLGNIHGFVSDCYWSDIGTLPSYYMTNHTVACNPPAFGFSF